MKVGQTGGSEGESALKILYNYMYNIERPNNLSSKHPLSEYGEIFFKREREGEGVIEKERERRI